MKFRIVLVIILVAIMTASLFACASPDSTESQAGNQTLFNVIQNKKVRVGVLPDYAPWCSRNADGDFEGYDVDIAKALGEAMDVQVEFVPVEAPNRVPSLVSNKVDVIIACLTPTDERAKTIAFTIPYASAGQIPMVKIDNTDINSYEDLAGKKVAIVRGGTPDLYTTMLIPDADIIRFDTIADAYAAFKSGQAVALVEEDSFVYAEIKANPELYKAAGEPFSTELISIAIKQGDHEWLNYLNNFLTNLRFTGKNAQLYEKWFGSKPASLVLD